ncbi:nucleotide-binding domain-containing protein [Lepidopterella palustris CBS 459.81]|uniref:Nucleotide-binding domain-containing protein n=1 Tax=Lepidopterella palustris CBS 459.81 TaxID=1314670 RepID=A0A8E2ECD9_9PEZI|nr:nucleotide-binding domain-containing protein [Lepidopterella palustris CBS 459.81]
MVTMSTSKKVLAVLVLLSSIFLYYYRTGSMSSSQKLVVVLGGGVVGLQTAVDLLEAGYAVTLLSKHLPGDEDPHYPSQQAAATWASDEPAVDAETKQWYDEGYKRWDEMSNGAEFKSAGVTRRPCFRYWEEPPRGGESALWHSSGVSSFRILDPPDLPSGVAFGTTFTTFCVNAPEYLNYLHNRIIALGGDVIRATLPTDQGLVKGLQAALEVLKNKTSVVQEEDVYAYVNAMGEGGLRMAGDKGLFPIRSQSIHIRGEAHKIADRIGDSGIYYAIPRVGSGITVLGGFMEMGNWNETVNPEVNANILRGCKKLIPECLNEHGEFDVVAEFVGFRPHRKAGARVEIEQIKSLSGSGNITVVHNYAHGPGGFFKSVGASRKVVRLVDSLSSGIILDQNVSKKEEQEVFEGFYRQGKASG